MISLIITVLNENKSLGMWLESIASQSILPDELVIVDGGSTDGTWELLQNLKITNVSCVVAQKIGNISSGRNEAIKLATGDIIVVTDAGCIYDKYWFKKIKEAFTERVNVVSTGFGPWFDPSDGQRWYLIAAATTPASNEFKHDWLPSSRSVAFRKKVWEAVGGYPEWLPICEDVIFDLKIKKAGYIIDYIREVLVFWRPRPSFKSYFLQLFRYTRGDGHGKLWFKRQLIRYGVYSVLAVIVILSFYNFDYLILAILAMPFYMKKFWLRYFEYTKNKSLYFRVSGVLLMPFIIAFGDLAKMSGWPIGVSQRLTKRIIFEKY
ncbi:MAG: glycosyltransferase [bacterium]